jgi:spermidine synthase
LIVVDVASDDGIDDRFLSEEYFDSIKNCLTNNGLFVSNLCASPDFEHEENTFFKSIKKLYKETFEKIEIFKGNESDRVYYKSFFDINQRVIDITNVIIISSMSEFVISKNYAQFEKIDLDIKPYLKDKI